MLLDSDVLIDLLREYFPAEQWLATLPGLPPVAGFAAMELINGCRDSRELRRVRHFLATFTILWPSENGLNQALNDLMPLKVSHGLGWVDSLIAATALTHDLPLATFNVRHFDAVPGLETREPYSRL